MSAIKKIRLEQKAMPVSSEEELSIITLREQNQKLSNNYSHRMRIESDLRKKIEKLEETLKSCEDKEPEHQLTIVNEELRDRIDELEFELNKSRLNEKRFADDLDRLNKEFTELRKKSLLSSNSDSIRSSTSVVNYHHHHHTPLNTTSATTTNTSHNSTNLLTNSSSSSDHTNQHHDINSNTGPSNILTAQNLSPNDNNHFVINQANAIQDLEIKLADQIELANNRLNELETLNEQHKDALLTIDRLKSEARSIPKEIIIETAEYKTLQSHFSVLYNEATQLKTQLIESRALIMDMKNAHTRQIERMEQEELHIQNDLRTDILKLETNVTETRNQLAVYRLQYENVLKENERTLKMDNELKKCVRGYKDQVTQKNQDLNRLKRILEEVKRTANERHQSANDSTVTNKTSSHVNNNGDNLNNSVSNHSADVTHANNTADDNTTNPSSASSSNKNNSVNHNATVNNISNNNNTTTNANNLSSPTNKKILELKEVIHQLQKQLDKTKSEEEALMQELDVTGQAYEDMQEQNHRLLQQLEEKDDANFKLMTEHLKTNSFQKHLNEEKALMEECRDKLKERIAAQDLHVKGLQEKIHLLQENTATLEKEITVRGTLNETYKQEVLELKQQLAELKLEKEKVSLHLDQIQKSFNERTITLTHESLKNKRLVEELESIKKKYERASKMQSATAPDEVLVEEIREYKEQLTCPSCKTKPKDAVLTKCFHVFCFDCLKTRVDTRQRKCPKCNAQFGANDFHRLYLA